MKKSLISKYSYRNRSRARARARSRRSSSGSNTLPMLLVLGGAGFALYAFTQSKKKTPLLASGTTYAPPTTNNLVNSFFTTIKNLFGSSGSPSTTGLTGTSPWYDLESAMGKYPMSQYPNLWSYDPVTQQPQFRGAYDIDIALATA